MLNILTVHLGEFDFLKQSNISWYILDSNTP